MKRITAESTIEEVMKDIGVGAGEDLHESAKRERFLEKFAQLRSRNPSTELTLDEVETAYVTAEEDEDGEFIDITITTKGFPQPTTNLPIDYHFYLIQKGMTIHEAAHIMYSSYPAMKKYLDKVEEEEDDDVYVSMFKNIFNVLEDGAIEKFAQEDFRVEEELLHLRTTLHESHYMGQEVTKKDKTEYHYPFYFAIMAALLNIGVYDNEELENLLDEDNDKHVMPARGGEYDRKMLIETLPTCREYIEKIQSERDAEKRAKLSYQLWDYLKDYIQNSHTPGNNRLKKQQNNKERESYAPSVPENLGEQHGEQERKPTQAGGDSSDNAGDGTQTLGDSRKKAVEEAEGNLPDEVGEKAQQEIIQEAKEEGNDWSDELEEILQSLGAGDGVEEIFIPEDGKVDRERKREAERYGKRCAKIFKSRLKRQQKDRTVRHKHHGEFDDKSLIKGERGSPRVCKKVREGDKKNYSCIIVCDRSGSMSARMEDVELAAGAVAYGLEAVGVDTSIMDTYQSKTTIAKPFQTNVEDFAEKLFAGRISGGTPLRYTLKFANERIERGQGDVPFMIVITDGNPRRRDVVKEEIKKANFPVLGMYLTNNEKTDQLKLYNRAVTVKNDEDVAQKLINLITSVVF